MICVESAASIVPTPRYDLIVFDLDGTLIDSRHDLANAVNDMLSAVHATPLPLETIVPMIGEGARVLVERALRAAAVSPPESEALAKFLASYERRMLELTQCYPGVESMLMTLAQRTTLAVLTNKPLGPTHRLLEHFGLAAHFRGVIGGDGPFPRKPDPEGLLSLAERFGVETSRTLMVGDSPVDAETARRAGVACCLVAYGFGYLGRRGDQEEAADVGVVERSIDLIPFCMG